MVLAGRSLQEYSVNAEVLQDFILGRILFLLYINDLPDDFICNIVIYADDTTLHSKFDQVSNLWQHFELASELDLQGTINWGREWLVDSFDQSNNTGAIDEKIDGSVLEKKSTLKMLGMTFSSKLDWGLLHYLYC